MDTIAVSELRANLMKILKEIKAGSEINITSRGKVIAKLVPPDNVTYEAKAKLAEVAESAVLYDLVAPIDEQWDAEQ